MNIAKSYDFFKPETFSDRIHIIGCGAIGSTVAENLVRFGITRISLYDFDTVESHNITNQLYTEEDIGKGKVDALAEHLIAINPELADKRLLKLIPEGYTSQKLTGYVILAVDSIELRKQIVTANKSNMMIKAMFDFRMRLTDAQHYAADWSKLEEIENFCDSMNFSSEEAKESTPVSACNLTLSVCPTVRLICALGVSNLINFAKGDGLKNIIIADAFNFTLSVV